jgi:hypothetical protein
MTRRRLAALWVSCATHLGIGAIVTALASFANAAGSAPSLRTIQLNGTRADRSAGFDVLRDILAGSGMPLRLTSPDGGEAVGLAWWTPTVGLWLAIDRARVDGEGRSLEVSVQVGEGPATTVARIDIDATGSGRIVSTWTREYPPAGTPVTLTVSAPVFPRWRESVVELAATAPMRPPR